MIYLRIKYIIFIYILESSVLNCNVWSINIKFHINILRTLLSDSRIYKELKEVSDDYKINWKCKVKRSITNKLLINNKCLNATNVHLRYG